MKRNKKKVPPFDDIIFENRNKEYGAYNLRKHYKSATSLSILGGITLYTVLFILISASTPSPVTANHGPGIFIVVVTDSTLDPTKIVHPTPEKPVEVPVQHRYFAPEVVDSVDVDNPMMIYDLAIDSVKNEPVTKTIDSIKYVPAADDINEEEEIFIVVEEPPVFPGGNEALMKYIFDNTKYPPEAISNNIQGKVFIKFAVSSDGSVKKIEVLRGVHPLLDEEAARVVASLPTWKPGKQNGKPVPVWFSVPVNFQLINH